MTCRLGKSIWASSTIRRTGSADRRHWVMVLLQSLTTFDCTNVDVHNGSAQLENPGCRSLAFSYGQGKFVLLMQPMLLGRDVRSKFARCLSKRSGISSDWALK